LRSRALCRKIAEKPIAYATGKPKSSHIAFLLNMSQGQSPEPAYLQSFAAFRFIRRK
jgi:hypothetical protein